MARSRTLSSSCTISLSCRCGNSLPMILVMSKDSYPSKDPELIRGALVLGIFLTPLVMSEMVGASCGSTRIADGDMS